MGGCSKWGGLDLLQAIAFGLFFTEPDFAIAGPALTSAVYQVSKGNLLCMRSLCVRKDSMVRNIVANEVLDQAALMMSTQGRAAAGAN